MTGSGSLCFVLHTYSRKGPPQMLVGEAHSIRKLWVPGNNLDKVCSQSISQIDWQNACRELRKVVSPWTDLRVS